MDIPSLKVSELASWLGDPLVSVIDVREDHEYRACHIKEAVHIPLSQINWQHIAPPPAKVVLQCRSGYRSLTAALKLKEQNPQLQVYNLEGGILAWMAAGYPVIELQKGMTP